MSSVVLPPAVELTAGAGGLEVLRVSAPRCAAEIYLQGAHLTQWTPGSHDPVLWASAESRFEPGSPIRGGVPLCGPWFAEGSSGDRAPSHGWWRITPWRLVSAADNEDVVSLGFELTAAECPLPDPGVPPDARFSYLVSMGEELRLSLTVHAGADEVRLEEALHTYLLVHAWEQSSIHGLGGASYFDKLTGRTETAPDGEFRLPGETDRVFHSAGAVTVRSEPLGRDVTVAKANSASTVVWNPGPENAAELDDMGAAESHEFICVETANALGDAVTVPPHTAHTMSCLITLEPATPA